MGTEQRLPAASPDSATSRTIKRLVLAAAYILRRLLLQVEHSQRDKKDEPD